MRPIASRGDLGVNQNVNHPSAPKQASEAPTQAGTHAIAIDMRT